jgi:hypothetical protein
MSRIRGKQIYADTTPIHPYDVVNKEYVDNIVISGSTSGSTLTIEDEGVLVSSGVTVLNFIGDTVRAMQGTGRVDIYIPPPSYSSHFNLQDGSTDARLSNISTTSRYIAEPTNTGGTPYYIGDWIAGTAHNTIRNSVSSISYTTPETFSIFNSSSTTLVATLLDYAGNPTSYTQTKILNGNSSTFMSGVTINVTNWSSDSDRFRATVSVSFNLSGVFPQGGRFGISIVHNNGGDGIYSFIQNDIFKDNEELTASISGSTLTVVEGNSVVTKRISGVEFYTLNTQWHVNINNIENLNSRSYPTTQQLNIDETNFFISGALNVNGNGGSYDTFSGGTWTNSHLSTNAVYDKTDWTTDQTNQTNWNHNSNTINTNVATASIYDWSLVGTRNSINYNYLIETYVDLSDRNSEMFRTETNASFPRLQSDLTTALNSNLDLSVVDGGNGLQVLADRLVYPKNDFTLYNPNPSSQPDYTSITGNKSYYRRFNTDGTTAYNGIITFSDHNITEADLAANDVIFEISVDNGVNWLNLNVLYDGINTGDTTGCRIDNDVYNLPSNNIRFSLQGLYSTFIYFKITFADTVTGRNKYIGGMDIISDHWI